MSEKLRLGALHPAQSVDPIGFSDETIFGLDPAVHWIERNNQREQFPEIVTEITAHWNDQDWLEKLLCRMGYTNDCYDPERAPRGIYTRAPTQERSLIKALHIFLLRAAGIKYEQIRNMFGESRGDAPWRFAKVSLDDVMQRRRALMPKSPRRSVDR